MESVEQAEVLARFGGRVKAERESKGLSQERLGFECGLSQTYISEVESGKRNISLANMYGIAQALGISLARLVTDV